MKLPEHPMFELVGKRLQGVKATDLDRCTASAVRLDFTDGSFLTLSVAMNPMLIDCGIGPRD